MDLDQEYIEYVAESSLALLAISAFYFFDPGSPVTYLTLLIVPVLFGYTSYISREGFNRASLLGGISLIFIPLGVKMGFFAFFISISNSLVSFFSGGEGMNSYSSSTYLPMILTGLLLGFIVFGAAQTNQAVETALVDKSSNAVAESVSSLIDETGLIESQKQAVGDTMESVSEATVIMTASYVRNNTDLDQQSESEVTSAFESAREQVPENMRDRIESQDTSLDISARIKDATSSILENNLYVFAFVIAMGLYSLNPVISLLTGFSGKLFEMLGEE